MICVVFYLIFVLFYCLYRHRSTIFTIILLILVYYLLDKLWVILQGLWENELVVFGVIFLPFTIYACYLYIKKLNIGLKQDSEKNGSVAEQLCLHDSSDVQCNPVAELYSPNLILSMNPSSNNSEVNLCSVTSSQLAIAEKNCFVEFNKDHNLGASTNMFYYPSSTLLEQGGLPFPFIHLRDGVETRDFINSSTTSFLVGKGQSGEAIVEDMQLLSHLLVVGTTGSGKSSFLHSLIISSLFKCTPDEIRFILVDTKVVEFAPYNSIPHLLLPVLTDPVKAFASLRWLNTEVSARFRLFQKYNVRNITVYNDFALKNEIPLLPSVFFVVDELSSLMTVEPSVALKLISFLVRTGSAAGVHLILSTQFPMKSIVPDSIKLNIPSRIAFSVNTREESRFVLGVDGAEKLNAPGELLFLNSYNKIPAKVQSYFTSFEDVKNVTKFLHQDA